MYSAPTARPWSLRARLATIAASAALIAGVLIAIPATVAPTPPPAANATFDFTCTSTQGFAYFVNTNAGSVSMVYSGTDQTIRNIPLGGGAPFGVAATPDGSHVYVAGGPGGVSVIDTDTLQVSSISDPSFSTPVGAWASPDGQRIFVSNHGANTVSVISTATNTVTNVIDLGGGGAEPGYMDASGNLLFVARDTAGTGPNTGSGPGSGPVAVIDMTTGSLVRVVPTGAGVGGAHTVAVNGTFIAYAMQGTTIDIRDQADPSALIRQINVPTNIGALHGISFVNGTNYLIAVSTGGRALVYDASTGVLERTLVGSTNMRTPVVSPLVNPDGSRDVWIAAGSGPTGGIADLITVQGPPVDWTLQQGVTNLQNFPDGHSPAFSCMRPLEADKAFAADTIPLAGSTRLTITIRNNNLAPTAGLTNAGVTDDLPSNIRVAATPNAATTCTSGTVTAAAGGTALTLAGASVPAATVDAAGVKEPGTCTVSVDVVGIASGTQTNTVPAGALTADLVGGSLDPFSAPITVLPPALRITKTHNDADGQVAPGQTVTYTVTVQNTATIDQDGITIGDTLPAGVTYVPQSTVATQGTTTRDNATGGATADLAGGDPTTGTLVSPADGFTIPAGESMTVQYQVTIDAPIQPASFLNTASVTSTQEPDAITSDVTLTPIPADISVEKDVLSAPTQTGNPGEYTTTSRITVTNAGGATGAYDLADDLSFGASQTVVSSSFARSATSTDPAQTGVAGASPTTADPVQIVANESLDGGRSEVWDVTTVFRVDMKAATAGTTDCSSADDPATGTRNIATLTSAGATSTADACAPVPALTIDKQPGTIATGADGRADAGDTITWPVVVTNNGSVTLTQVVVTDPVAETLTCPAATLDAGASVTCQASKALTQGEINAGSIQNTATADSAETGSAEDTVATPIAVVATLTLTKTAGTPTDVNASGITDEGDTVGYTFRVTNTGNVPVTALAISDPRMGAVTCQATSLAPGASTDCATDAFYTVTAADERAGVVTNTATAAATTPAGAAVTSNQAQASVTVAQPAPRLTLDKRTTATSFDRIGDVIEYTFAVENTGNVPVMALVINDPMLDAPATCATTALGVDESTTCRGAHTVVQADLDAGRVRNTATASGSAPGGTPVQSPADTVDVAFTATPALALTKSVDALGDTNADGFVDPGDTVRWAFVVENTGNVPIDGITITDPMIGPATCDSQLALPGERIRCVADAVYVLTDEDAQRGSVDNSATAAGQPVCPPNVDGSARVCDPVVSNASTTSTPVSTTPKPALSLDKRAAAPVDADGDGRIGAGDTIAYSFTVVNTGNALIRDVRVVDPMVGVVACAATDLAVGAETQCTAAPYAITAADMAAGGVHNEAHASATGPGGLSIDSNTDSIDTPLAPLPRLPRTGAEPNGLLLGLFVTLLGAGTLWVSVRRRRRGV